MPKNSLIILIVMISSVIWLSACQPHGEEVTNIRVETISAAKSPREREAIFLSNCDKNVELVETLGSLKTVEKKVTVDKIATSHSGLNYDISESLNLKLEIEIEDAYQHIYETTVLRLNNVEMKVQPGKQTAYSVQWETLVYQSKISFSYENDVYRVPYTYTLVAPKLIDEQKMMCPREAITASPDLPKPTTSTANIAIAILKKSVFPYAGPSTDYGGASDQLIHKSEKIYVIAKTADEQWFFIETFDGIRGWLYIEWIEISVPLSSIPVAPTSPPPPIAYP